MWKNIFIFIIGSMLVSCQSISNEWQVYQYISSLNDTLSYQAYQYLKENLPDEKWQYWINDPDFFIQDLNNALTQNRKQIENESLPFNVFAEYILPLQIDQEPIENWRNDCMDKFSFCIGKDIAYCCDTINSLLKKDFGFSLNEPSYTVMPWSYLDTLKKGDCFHMAKSLLYPLRALGYPTTIDFTPCWGNTTGAHSWNVVYINGKMEPFMGRERGVFQYKPFITYEFEDSTKEASCRYPAKVFRRTFSCNNSLQHLINGIPTTDLPAFLKDCHIKDVTAEYLPVSDIAIKVSDKCNEEQLIYLAVFSNDWTITACANREVNGVAVFKDMKKEMLYLPVTYKKGIMFPVGSPFITDQSGKVRSLEPTEPTDTCRISYLLPLITEISTAVANRDKLPKDIFDKLYSGEKRKRPVDGEEYSLFYWSNNRWKYIDTRTAVNFQLVFSKVPRNALLYLADKDNKFIGRCFTVNAGEISWW